VSSPDEGAPSTPYRAFMSSRTVHRGPPQSRPRAGPGSAAPPQPITIVLADDHKVVRSGLRVLLNSDARFRVVGEAGDVNATLEAVRSLRPRILVLDLNFGGDSSLESIPELRAEVPETQIVILTMQDDPGFARVALRAGALGYVLKDAADAELTDAVLLAAAGGTYLNPRLGARLAQEPRDGPAGPDDLSPREVEVLTLIALGHTNNEIAASLTLSVRTVESHRAHIQQKLGLVSRADLVAHARRRKLLM
jgi:two-component system response regulator NreC